MIIYENTKERFIDEVIKGELTDTILDLLKDKHIGGVNTSQISAFNNSLRFVKDVLDTEDIPNDCQVAIEYNIPQTSKRVDFMILGKDTSGQDNVVIIELKQWSTVSKVDDTFKHTVHSDLLGGSDSAHPSYQAYSYKTLLLNYCEHGFVSKDSLIPCAYLHNMSEAFRPVLEDTIYKEWIDEAPVFLRNDLFKLREFIKKYIRHKSNNGDLLYKIDYGKIKPQKSLQDSLDSMLCGNEEFKMIDEQVVAFDIIMNAVKQAQKDHKKHVVIIKGGPGTGKSVLAINVLCECISKLGLNASYITKNSAPRNCYLNLLSKGNAKKALDLKLAIMSPHAIPSLIDNAIDVGLFDEAHRLQKKPFMYRGNDLLMDLLATCQTSVFFIDENQKITTKDCYDIETIIRYATSIGAKIDTPIPYELSSQFRCGGSDGYIAFVDNLLGIRQTANYVFDDKDFDLRIFDNPNELREEIRKRNKTSRARMVAGYCYDWNVKNGRGDYDILLEDNFKARWNLPNDDIWAVNDKSIEEVGCIHTCQGMEFDYIGVFIGKDLLYVDGSVIVNPSAISKDDKSSGIKSTKNRQDADRLIRNTYKVLLTRGLKGCYIYCEDKELAKHIKSLIHISPKDYC